MASEEERNETLRNLDDMSTLVLEYICDSDYDSDKDNKDPQPVSVSSEPTTTDNENVALEFIGEDYFKTLASSIQAHEEDKKFDWAQNELRNNPLIVHVLSNLVSFFSAALMDDSEKNDVNEALSILTSIQSLMENTRLHEVHLFHHHDLDKLLDVLVFSLMDPESRCTSNDCSYMLKQQIAHIMVIFFDKCYTKISWETTIVKFSSAFDKDPGICDIYDEDRFTRQYGALIFFSKLNDQNLYKELFHILIDCEKKTRYAAFKLLPSRDIAILMRDKLQLIFLSYMMHWFKSPSASSSADMITDSIAHPDPHVGDTLCHLGQFKEMLVPYYFNTQYILRKFDVNNFNIRFGLFLHEPYPNYMNPNPVSNHFKKWMFPPIKIRKRRPGDLLTLNFDDVEFIHPRKDFKYPNMRPEFLKYSLKLLNSLKLSPKVLMNPEIVKIIQTSPEVLKIIPKVLKVLKLSPDVLMNPKVVKILKKSPVLLKISQKVPKRRQKITKRKRGVSKRSRRKVPMMSPGISHKNSEASFESTGVSDMNSETSFKSAGVSDISPGASDMDPGVSDMSPEVSKKSSTVSKKSPEVSKKSPRVHKMSHGVHKISHGIHKMSLAEDDGPFLSDWKTTELEAIRLESVNLAPPVQTKSTVSDPFVPVGTYKGMNYDCENMYFLNITVRPRSPDRDPAVLYPVRIICP